MSAIDQLSGRSRLIRDPLYEYVEVPPRLLPIVEHPLVQRLRRISQTSLTSSVYPAATGTRFEHSLGTMHLARRSVHSMYSNSPEATEKLLSLVAKAFTRLSAGTLGSLVADAVGAVALTHDIGHPPFSHALEDFFHKQHAKWFTTEPPAPWSTYTQVQRQFHEFAGLVLLHQLASDLQTLDDDTGAYAAFLSLILRIATADPDANDWPGALHSLVDGELDVDRLDYVMRDAQRAGTEFGSLDYVRLVDSVELHVQNPNQQEFAAGPSVNARSAAESLLLQRTQSYRWITFHHRVTAANLALTEAVDAMTSLSTDTETIVDLSDEKRSLADIFRHDSQILDYLTTSQLRRSVFPSDIATPASELQQASVDDGLVVRMLFEAMTIAEAVLADGIVDEGARRRLEHFEACARSALLREKRLIPAWKTDDEWRRVVEHYLFSPSNNQEPVGALLTTELEETIDAELKKYSEGSPGYIYLNRVGNGTIKLLQGQDTRVIAVNRILSQVMLTAPGRLDLATALMEAPGELRPWMKRGSWAIAHLTFSPLRSYDSRPGALFHEDEYVPLRKGSPIVDSLEQTEDQRVKTMCFFVGHDATEVYELSERNLIRPALKKRIEEVLPGFLLEHWPNRLRRLAETYEGKTGQQQ